MPVRGRRERVRLVLHRIPRDCAGLSAQLLHDLRGHGGDDVGELLGVRLPCTGTAIGPPGVVAGQIVGIRFGTFTVTVTPSLISIVTRHHTFQPRLTVVGSSKNVHRIRTTERSGMRSASAGSMRHDTESVVTVAGNVRAPASSVTVVLAGSATGESANLSGLPRFNQIRMRC